MNKSIRSFVYLLIVGLALCVSTSYAQTLGFTVQVSTSREFSTFLSDGDGYTLYTSSKDKLEASTCYGACTDVWYPVMVDRVFSAGSGADANLLGTVSRRDTYMQQLTYNGQPLYTYLGDHEPGHAFGHDLEVLGSLWQVISLTENGPVLPGQANTGTR